MTPPATIVVSDWAVLAKAPVIEGWLAVYGVVVGGGADPVNPDGKLVAKVFVGPLGVEGKTVGGATSGIPGGRLRGVHPTPPGPITIVTGLLEGPRMVVVVVEDTVAKSENVVGTKV